VTERLSERIGIYGGTFNPIHNGHIEIARLVARNFKLDQILIVPAARPPHKSHETISEAYHRYAMAVLATIDDPRLLVSTIEMLAPDKPYTFQTIERLQEQYGEQAEFFFIMGADSFNELGTWREPERLLASTNVIVAARPGDEIELSRPPDYEKPRIVDLRGTGDMTEDGANGTKIFLTDYIEVDISSTEIRRMVGEGRSIKGLVPPAVADYVEKYKLYRR
jgi:nicotinate-nucleotide adenylyltransferase